MLKKDKSEETLAELIRNARKEKGLSARKLANLLNLSHTEINNIESGYRVKPSIIVLKGIEQYLGIPFSKTATLAGYSKEDLRIDFERSSLILGTTEDYKEPVEDDTGTVIASNIKFPSFRYAYSIPISVLDIEKTEAKFENGLLFISIPPLKAEEKKRPVVVIK